jgi:hypothetical protein
MPFLFSLRGVEARDERKHQGGKGSAATSPALVYPVGIPLPRRPLCKEWPKGETHPHFGEKGKLVLAYVVPGGVAQTLRGLPFGSQPLQIVIFPSPSARRGPRWPQRPDGAGQGQRPCGGFGFQPRKRPGLKAKGFVIFPLPTLYLSLWVCGKAAYVSEHSSRFATPSAPRGSPSRWLPGQGRKLGGLVVLGGVECIAIWL